MSEFDDEEEEAPVRGARPVGVGAGADVDQDADDIDDVPLDDHAPDGAGRTEPATPPSLTEDGRPVIERPNDELLVGGLALLLAISVFLPWYRIGTLSKSGWTSGTWGPVTFFLALAAVAIVALRRIGKPISFPLEHSLILEGIGWIAVISVLIKRLLPVHINGLAAGSHWMIFITMVLGIGLAFAGGRTSTSAPFVIKPGWINAPGGKLGIAILGGAIVLGAVFGVINKAAPSATPFKPVSSPKYIKTFPKCASNSKFPQFGLKVSTALEPTSSTPFCIVSLSGKMSVNTALARVKTQLKAAGWTFKVNTVSKNVPTAALIRSVTLLGPQCGTVSIQPSKKLVVVNAYFQKCGTARPKP